MNGFLRIAVFALMALIASANVVIRPFKIGVLYSGNSPYGKGALTVSQMWEAHVKKQLDGIGGLGFQLEVIYEDVQSNSTLVTQLATKLITVDGVHALTAPENTLTDFAAAVANRHKVPIIAGMIGQTEAFVNTRTGQRKYDYLTGVLAPAEQYFRGFYSLMRIKKAKTTAIISGWENFEIETCRGGAEHALDHRIEVVSQDMVNTSTAQTEQETRAMIDQQLRSYFRKIRNLKPDSLLMCLRTQCGQAIKLMEEMGLNVGAVGLLQCVDSAGMTTGEYANNIRYMVGPSQWDYRLSGSIYTDAPSGENYCDMFPVTDENPEPSALQFRNKYRSMTGIDPHYIVASHLAGLYAIESALVRANSTDPEDLRIALSTLYTPSFFGLLTSNKMGMNYLKEAVLVQVDEHSELQVISPLASSSYDMVYPIPTWGHRFYEKQMYSEPIEHAVIAVVAVCCTISVVLGAIIFNFRNERALKATSVPFVLVSIVGSLLACVGVLTWGMDNNQATCDARVPVLLLGFALMIGPLMAKTYRIALIFNVKRTLRMVSLSDKKVALITLVIISPLILCCIIWVSAYPMTAKVVVPDPLRPSLNYTECFSEDWSIGFVVAALLVAYAVAMLFFAYRVRDAYELFNDANSIGLAMYALVVPLTLVAVVEFTVPGDNRATLFAIRSIGINLAFTSATIALILGRVLDVLNRRVHPDLPYTSNQTKLDSSHTNAGKRANSGGLTSSNPIGGSGSPTNQMVPLTGGRGHLVVTSSNSGARNGLVFTPSPGRNSPINAIKPVGRGSVGSSPQQFRN